MSGMTDYTKHTAEYTSDGPDEAQYNNEMTDDFTDFAEESDQPSGPKPFLEQAVDKAIYSLGEIISYAECGRPQGCLMEAREALELITILLAQHKETAGEKVPDQPLEVANE